MQDNSEGGELDLVVDVRKRYKKNYSSILFCIDKRTNACDCGNEVGTVHGWRGGEEPVL